MFPTKENKRVCTVLARVGALCFCLFASFRVVRVVLKICMRRVLDGVEVSNGNRISRSLGLIPVGEMEIPGGCDDSFFSQNDERLN